jgi:hypothetical protein
MAIHGSQAYFSLDTSGGTPTDLSAYVRGIDYSLDQAMHDTTTFGNSAHTKTVGLKDSKFSVTIVLNNTIMDHLTALYAAQTPGTTTTWSFIFGPRGSTGGFEKFSGECILISLPLPAQVDDIETTSVSFEVTGATTITTF